MSEQQVRKGRGEPHEQTKNQHFVSQVEQRLNALNPRARPENQRIYEFEIVDRDRHEVRLTSKKGRTIADTLSMFDLFSFDVDDGGARANFERAFSAYEKRIRELTALILQAHAARSNAIGQELFDLFVAKMVNFVRNPYSVEKVLNTFGALAQHHPADPAIYATYERILRGRRPQQAYLCRTLDITNEQYGAWLRVLRQIRRSVASYPHDGRESGRVKIGELLPTAELPLDEVRGVELRERTVAEHRLRPPCLAGSGRAENR